MTGLFTGMEWFPDCRDGGLDRYFYEALRAFSASGMKGTALVSAAAPTTLDGIAVRGMAGANAPVWQRWSGARAVAREVLRDGVDVVNAHFALYAFPLLRELPPGVPLVVNFQGPWADEMRVEARNFRKRAMARAAY